jgi:hypothetical protein
MAPKCQQKNRRFINEKIGNKAGLPDGLFSNQNIQIWVNFRGP